MPGNLRALMTTRTPDGPTTPEGRAASVRFRVWSLRRAVLLAAGTFLLLWLPIPRSDPAYPPTRRVQGTSGLTARRIALSRDGRTIVTADESGRVLLGRVERDDPGPFTTLDIRGIVKALAASPDGRWVAIGGRGPDVSLLDLEHPSAVRLLGIPIRQTSDLSFSPDGRLLAVSSYDSRDIILWDLEAGIPRKILRGPRTVYLAVLSPDGRSLASVTMGDHAILLWDLADGRPRRLSGMNGPTFALAFSPDARWLAIAGPERRVRIRDLWAGREAIVVPGHTLPTCSLAFSPDGRLLATASGDGTAALWSMPEGRLWRRLDAQADNLRAIAFSADGTTLGVAANDGEIRLWDMDTLLENPLHRER